MNERSPERVPSRWASPGPNPRGRSATASRVAVGSAGSSVCSLYISAFRWLGVNRRVCNGETPHGSQHANEPG